MLKPLVADFVGRTCVAVRRKRKIKIHAAHCKQVRPTRAGTDDDSPHSKEEVLPLFGQLLSQLCEAFEAN